MDAFSDESSFYGDDDQVSRLEHQANSYDPEPYWTTIHPHLLSTIQRQQQEKQKQHKQNQKPTKSKPAITSITSPKMEPEVKSEPESDIPLPKTARGPNESIPDFLSRLPPSTTRLSTVGPWLFVSDPKRKKTVTGEVDKDIAALVSAGTELLHGFENQMAEMSAEHDRSGSKSKAVLTRKLNPLRRALEQEILALAREHGVIVGKWMFFPSVANVDRIWAKIAQATINGELGIQAKVATNGDIGGGSQNASRLICVYTHDFQDTEDIARVVRKLADLGLVRRDDRPIYYKPDAYTYLEIKSGNQYGLKPTLYSSRDML